MKKGFLVCAALLALGMMAACDDEEPPRPSPVSNPKVYTVTVPDYLYGGDVEGAGEYKEGDTATLVAKPWAMFYFVCWSDGDHHSEIKKFVVTQDTLFSAYFKPIEI